MNDLCEIPITAEEIKLISKGWEKQFTCAEPRLTESVDLFLSMGREVMTIGVAIENLSDTDGCKDCFVSCSGDVKTIWTRNKKNLSLMMP
jgi:hypothetical protein